MNLENFRQTLRQGRVEWRKHVLQRLAERGILQHAVLDVLLTGEIIEDYSDDKPFPSALFFSYVSKQPLHVVAAFDEVNEQAYIITAYEPSLDIFESDFRTRRNK